MEKRFKIKLKQYHDKTVLSGYAVSKGSGVSQNTARKYIEKDEIIAEKIPITVILLCDFYGVDWRDPEVIEVFEEDTEANDATNTKTPRPATA